MAAKRLGWCGGITKIQIQLQTRKYKYKYKYTDTQIQINGALGGRLDFVRHTLQRFFPCCVEDTIQVSAVLCILLGIG